MSTSPSPSIFEAFNARALEPHQVAQTFVPSKNYGELAQAAHTLVVGPRGSGKTTLLKMLQQTALEAWQHPQADEYRRNISFTGVFIATDVSWREQISSLGDGDNDDAHSRYLTNAAFTTHCLRALISAMDRKCHPLGKTQLGHRRVVFEPFKQETMAKQLATAWHLTPMLHTLLGIKYALSQRLLELRELGNQEALLGHSGRPERLASVPYLNTDFLEAAGLAVEMFDDFTADGRGRWALLFDELELAPPWILQKLVSSLRSVNDKFLFKLSMSPFSQDITLLQDALSATQGNDFSVVPLWYAHKEDGYAFCEDLFKSMLVAKGLHSISDSEEVFGRSEFETSRDEWARSGTAYHPGTRLQHRFTQLATNDASFRKYLKKKHIAPDLSNIPTGDARAADVRKITSIVAIRNAFRVPDDARERGTRQLVRSRKNVPLYSGSTALFAMSEGNPRWLKGILGRLIAELSDDKKTVDKSIQSREVMNSAHRFRALLRTIPGPGIRRVRGLLSILDKIGTFFFSATVLEDFNPEPPGSFIVDSRSSSDVIDGIAKAVNAGAVVYVPEDSGQLLLGSLRGKRFRLSYLLAPYYQTPLTLGKAHSLSGILLEEPSRPLLDDMVDDNETT